MPFVPDSSEPIKKGFVPDSQTPWSDVPMNAVKNVGDIAKAGIGATKNLIDPANVIESTFAGSMEPTKKAISQGAEGLKAMPGALFNEAKETFKNPGETFKKNPVNTALNVAAVAAPVLGMFGKGIEAARFAEAAKVAETAGEIPRAIPKPPVVEPPVSRVAPSAPPPINIGDEAASILKEPIKQTPPPETPPPAEPVKPSTFEDLKSKIPKEISDPMQQVNEYLKNQYGKVSKKPGFNDVMSDYLKEHSRNMTLKELGAAPGQVRKIGVPRAHELADYALENNYAGPKIGTIGREAKIRTNLESAGGAVGAFRKMAADRGAVQDPAQLVNQIRERLDSKYLSEGLYSGEKKAYAQALKELGKSVGRADSLADKISEMFREAKNQDRLKRPSGAIADVARIAREVNHDSIAKVLTPKELAIYERSLEDYGALTQLNEFAKRRASTEAGGRLGPGSGISRMAVQKFLDSVGYRAEAKIMSRLADKIKSNPAITERPSNLFRAYADEAAEAIDDMGDFQH